MKDEKSLGDRPSRPSPSSSAYGISITESLPEVSWFRLEGSFVSAGNGVVESGAHDAKVVILFDLVTGNVRQSRDRSSRCINKQTGAICDPIHLPRLRYRVRRGVNVSIPRQSS